MKIPKGLRDLADSFQKLPGIGPKSAQRLAFYLLRVPQAELDSFSESLSTLKKSIKLCEVCKNVGEGELCAVCEDPKRDPSVILVVEEPLDVVAFEKTGKYHGLYHVLHGSINPLENIGPDELYIEDLFKRTGAKNGHSVKEVIVATDPNMEGEATAMYLSKKLKVQNQNLKISRLGMGIPTGADLEYADEVTLTKAIEGRTII